MMYQNSYSYSYDLFISASYKHCIICTHDDDGNIAANTMYSAYSLQEGEGHSVSS